MMLSVDRPSALRATTAPQGPRPLTRAELARARVPLARAALAECRLCAHDCGANRLASPAGVCRAGAHPRTFCAQIEAGDESELVPTFAIAFSGCDLRCEFCVTRAESWNAGAGSPVPVQELVSRIERALDNGARTVMFLGGEPTVHLPAVLEIVAGLPSSARLVWKTNAHASSHARPLMEGLFDVWLVDYKFGNDACAQALARVPGYVGVVRRNLVWASGRSELIIRHLLMPGHVACCWQPVARWIAQELPGVKVSLRDGFWPSVRARHQELRRVATRAERQGAFDFAEELGLNLVS